MSTSTSPKQQLFAELSRIAAALASPARLDLVELLAQGRRSVDELAALTGLSVANTSQHLQKLRQAGLTTGRKEGQRVFYSLAGDDVLALVAALRGTAEAHVAEVDRVLQAYFRSRDSLEPVPAADLLERARKGLVTVLDVRPAEEFAAGHLPGAVNIPVQELARRLAELPKRKEVVAYCRGPYCLMSFEAVELLRRKGLKARRLVDGMPEWRAAGLPVER